MAFVIFTKKLSKYQLFCKDYNCREITMPKKFRMALNKNTNKMEAVSGNINMSLEITLCNTTFLLSMTLR